MGRVAALAERYVEGQPGGVLPQSQHCVPLVQLPEAVRGVEGGMRDVRRYATGALAGLSGSVRALRLGVIVWLAD